MIVRIKQPPLFYKVHHGNLSRMPVTGTGIQSVTWLYNRKHRESKWVRMMVWGPFRRSGNYRPQSYESFVYSEVLWHQYIRGLPLSFLSLFSIWKSHIDGAVYYMFSFQSTKSHKSGGARWTEKQRSGQPLTTLSQRPDLYAVSFQCCVRVIDKKDTLLGSTVKTTV